MSALDLFLHLINFVLPAVFVAGSLALITPLIWRKSTPRYSRLRTWLVGSTGGVGALALGLWFYGVDGKIATYSVMIGSQALWQWWAQRP